MAFFMLLPVSLCCWNILLSQGGDLGSMTDAHMPRLYLLQWLKSDRALMMLFNDGTFQVNTRKRNTVAVRHPLLLSTLLLCNKHNCLSKRKAFSFVTPNVAQTLIIKSTIITVRIVRTEKPTSHTFSCLITFNFGDTE